MKLPSIFSAYKIYFILAAVALILGGVFYAAWSWRGTIAEREQAKAVTSAVDKAVVDIQAKLEEERKSRVYFQTLADRTLAALSNKLDGIRATQTQVKSSISKGIARDQQFYSQPIPLPEREAWLKARNQAVQQPSQPASSPSP